MSTPKLDKWGRRLVSAYVPVGLVVRLDRFGQEHGYFSRSELVSDAIREFLEEHRDRQVGPTPEQQRNRVTQPPSDLRPPYYGIKRDEPDS